MGIHHVQLACPAGSEDALRAFYGGILGLAEKPKPPALAVRGGCWFVGEGIELHLGVEQDFRPARKAHPGLEWPDLDGLAAHLERSGYPVTWADPAEIPGIRRFHTHDPHGNRLEFLTPSPTPRGDLGFGTPQNEGQESKIAAAGETHRTNAANRRRLSDC